MQNIDIKVADITKENVCAVVNAANSFLLGGGGVDGAIHRAGGETILKECQEIRKLKYQDGLPVGNAVYTSAGNMPCKYVIHTVGPIYAHCGTECEKLLADCYRNSLKVAIELGCKDISFPAISTGIYGYPKVKAAKVAFETVKEFLKEYPIKVNFVFSSKESMDIFKEAIAYLKT